MSKEEQQIKQRDRYMQRLKEKYPDKEFADDEAMYAQAMADYDDYDKKVGEYEKDRNAMSEMFVNHPEMSLPFAYMMKKGNDDKQPGVIEAMIEQYGPMFEEALHDPDKLEKITEANNKFAARVQKEAELKKQADENWEESLNTMDKFQDEKQLDDEKMTSIMELLIGMSLRHSVKLYTYEDMEMALKALDHDADVEQADKEGEVRGKNSRIQEHLKKTAKKEGESTLTGKGGGAPSKPRADLGVLNEYGDDYKDIYERGGMKRKKLS